MQSHQLLPGLSVLLIAGIHRALMLQAHHVPPPETGYIIFAISVNTVIRFIFTYTGNAADALLLSLSPLQLPGTC